jgi:phage tail-like protein
MTQPTSRITANRFSLAANGDEIVSFAELLGIVTEVEPRDYLEQCNTEEVHRKLSGKLKPPTVTFKCGAGFEGIWAWHDSVRTEGIAAAQKNCTLTVYNTEGKPVARYRLEKAWPSKIEVAGLKAGANEMLMEVVTLVAERVSPS